MTHSARPARGRLILALLVVLGAGLVALTGSAKNAGAQEAAATGRPDTGTGDPPRAATPATSGVGRGQDSVTLLAQSPWVSDRQNFHLRLLVTASDPDNEQLDLIVYNRLTTRTGFDEAMSGQIHGYSVYPLSLSLSSLPADPSGGVDIDIPVNEPSTGQIPTFNAAAGSGVFPVQIGLYHNATLRGQLVNTFLVYAEPPSLSGLPKLSVSLTMPFHVPPSVGNRGQLEPLPSNQSLQLAGVVDTLVAHPNVKLTLAVTPQTLDALASPSASDVDRSTLADLEQLVDAGRVQVTPATYASVPLRGWSAAGLNAELNDQLNAGSSVLARYLGAAPSSGTWVINASLDVSSVRTLQARGAGRFIVPDSELSTLPALAEVTTFALPTQLVGVGGKALVYGADSGLTADFSNPGGPVLAATQLLAEMAMIQLETPGLTRGVAVLPPTGWAVNSTFVDTLLAGLDGHPLLNPVTASGLFTAVPVAPLDRSLVVPAPAAGAGSPAAAGRATPAGSEAGSAATGSGASPGTGSAASRSAPAGSTAATAGPVTSAAGAGGATSVAPGSVTTAPAQAAGVTGDVGSVLGADIPSILAARQGLSGMVAVLPQDAGRVITLNKQLLTAESSDLTEAQRQSLLHEIQTAITQVTSLITLPRSSSITLTSTRGAIPLTVFSAPSVHPRVELRLSSERLIFRPFTPPNGKCTVPTSTSEVCDLTLTTQNTTLKVPVETRTSGVFPLEVSLWTPDGSQLIVQERDTVRSTAVSGVGVVLIVAAVLFLGVWWVRDLRHGRRARKLVPPPDDEAVADGKPPVPGEPVGAPADGVEPLDYAEPVGSEGPAPDPVMQQFFSTPAPRYRDQASGSRS